MTAIAPFSEYVVYVDESGDHGLENMDASYPMFVLAFCIFRKPEYLAQVVPVFQGFKFKYFGHDLVVLHEHEMRKQTGPFRILVDRARRDSFMGDLDALVAAAPFTVVAAVIHKGKLKAQYAKPTNPDHLGVAFCLERLKYFLSDAKAPAGVVHVVFESRGRREDAELELEFRRVCSSNLSGSPFPFEPIFASKGSNSTGLQLADLVARPIGRHVLLPDQPNRAYQIIETKLRRSPTGVVQGYGLKCFP
jgi:hypothetical protein